MFSAFYALLRRDMLLAIRRPGEVVDAWLFFILIVCLFPLGTRPDEGLMAAFAPAIIWIAALLSTLLSLDRIFKSDFLDGSLEQILLCPQPVSILVIAKVLVHWVSSGLLLIIVSPLMAIILGLPAEAIPVLMLSLFLGTPVLSLVGAIAVALTVGLRGAGLLLPLLLLPLYTPILIFGSHAVQAAATGMSAEGPLYLLAAILLLAFTLAPLAIAAALRISVE